MDSAAAAHQTTSHQHQPIAKVTRTHTSAHSLALATILISTSNPPTSPKQLPAAFHLSLPRCHQSPPSILLDSPLSPTPWVVAPRQGTRIVPSVWLAAAPVVQDLACCAALVNRISRSRITCTRPVASPRCSLLNISHRRLHAAPSQRYGPAARLCMRE